MYNDKMRRFGLKFNTHTKRVRDEKFLLPNFESAHHNYFIAFVRL